jgi:hypothetical protein
VGNAKLIDRLTLRSVIGSGVTEVSKLEWRIRTHGVAS